MKQDSQSPLTLDSLTLKGAVEWLQKKAITPEELLTHYYNKIEADKTHPQPLNAVVHLSKEKAFAAAKRVKRETLLSGAPILIKDNMHVLGEPMECCSKILEGYLSPYTGGACERLEAHGGIAFGRTNMDEFAMGSSNETSYRGLVRNPINRAYTPGGSSGGAAASVRTDFCLGAIGSDTGGSVRQPAGCCGVIGLKPTYGRVSRRGLVAFASSLDQIGPITKTVEDSALLLQAISGHDEEDSTSIDVAVPNYVEALERSLRGKTIGIAKEFFPSNASSAVINAVEKVIDFYERAGCTLKEVSIPTLKTAISVYYVIATAEASTNLARYDGVRYGHRSQESKTLEQLYLKSRSEGFGQEVKRRILMGTYMLSSGYYEAYYLKAQKVRSMMKEDFTGRLEGCEVLIGPTMTNEVFQIGQKTENPVDMYLSDTLTNASNLTGLPSIAIPCGKDAKGLPISYQLIGRPFEEETLLNFGHLYQKENPWRY